MVHKPLTVARRDYVEGIVNLTNKTDLPMFVKVEVLERMLDEMRPLIDTELKRDEASYRAALQEEKATEPTSPKKKEE
jgi:hypothetical protein